jgi:hypothetical protein
MPKRNTTTDLVQAVLSEGRTTLDDLRAELNTPSRKRELERAKVRAGEIAAWASHVGAYVIVIGFLFVLNLITGTDWWFYWPALGWGIALAVHTWTTFGPRMDDDWQERKAQEWVAKRQGRSAKPQRFGASVASHSGADVSIAQLTQQAANKIDELRRIARRIPKPAVRRQALELLASSDQVVAALSDGSGNEEMARTFLDRYLSPAGVILERYQRLAARDIASAEPVLRRVEEHDLPLLNRRVQELHDKLHQGDVIDLQVASEMLAFELDEPDPSGPALDSTSTLSETRS